MADLARIDLVAGGEEARLRALLEDYVDYCRGVYPHGPLALAVWFHKAPRGSEHSLLLLFTLRSDRINQFHDSLYWKQGIQGPPFMNVFSTSVDDFTSRLSSNSQELAQFFERYDVIYFDKRLLNEQILRAFNVITEPSGLLKGWYISAREYDEANDPKIRNLLSRHATAKPDIGLVRTWDSESFDHCRGLLHAEYQQRWLPISPGGLRGFLLYNDYQDGRQVYFLFEGGSLYQLLKIEVKTAPEYSALVLEKLRDDRYPEVYLRALLPPGRSEP